MKPVTVASFNSRDEAEPLRQRLSEAGISAAVRDDAEAHELVQFARPSAGVRLEVPREDFETALQLVRAWNAGQEATDPMSAGPDWMQALGASSESEADRMTLPDEIRLLLEGQGMAHPGVVLRALYDLEGNLGETYLAADERQVVLLPRRLGEDWRCLDLPWTAVDVLTVESEGLCRVLRFEAAGQSWVLRFSAWDGEALARLVALWPGHSCATLDENRGSDQATAVSPSNPGPGVVFAACLAALARSDGCFDHGELQLMVELTGRVDWIEQGQRWLDQAGPEAVLQAAADGLSADQRVCLLGNLLRLGMVDGWLRGVERDWVESCRAALKVPPDELERIEGVLMARQQLSVFGSPAGSQVEPLVLFCAVIQGFAQLQGPLLTAELACLQRILDDPEVWQCGEDYLRDRSLEGALETIRDEFDPAQKRCLLTNLIGVAIADGTLSRPEQARLESVCDQLGLPRADYETMVQVLTKTAGTGVFADR